MEPKGGWILGSNTTPDEISFGAIVSHSKLYKVIICPVCVCGTVVAMKK